MDAEALEELARHPERADRRLIEAAARLVDAARKLERRAAKRRDADLRLQPGAPGEYATPRSCYVCQAAFTRRHEDNAALCPRCAEEGMRQRIRAADLSGRWALVTGGRVRIGFATALRLLRAGAGVVATTRFPRDAERRFLSEADSQEWRERLRIEGLDLRPLHLVERFADRLELPHLDILINNAAQTVRREPEAYAALVAAERLSLMGPVGQMGLVSQDGLALDTGESNSWSLRVGEVGLAELVEAHLVNGLAPFVLLQRLLPLLMRSPHAARFVVNVSSREGRLSVAHDGRHPHTDMAKASLNMMTRSVAPDLAARGVFVNSVDPGWVSHQGTALEQDDLSRQGVHPPLDADDGAARVCAPIFDALATGEPAWGKLFKDFREVMW